jgi:DNA-binding NarL/FixJ family response regulator
VSAPGADQEGIVRVLIADDHPPTRAGVRASLEGKGFAIVAESGDAATAMEDARRERPDVCLLDINMPGNGIAAAAKITAELPDVAVVMLTVSRSDDDLFDALRAGALGYLLKDTNPDRLPDALRGVLAGEAAMPASLVARLMDEFRGKRRRRVRVRDRPAVDLTDREWHVLELLRDGLSTEQIAERLFVTPVTIRTHVSSILKKLKVSSRDEALRLLQEE